MIGKLRIFMFLGLLVIGIVFISGCVQEKAATNSTEPTVSAPEQKSSDYIVTGPCSYEKFRGTGRIISIQQTELSKQQAAISGSSGYEGFEVKFRFTPVEPQNIKNVKWVQNTQEDILNKEYLLLLTNSWYPGQKYLEKYNIKENATFNGELLLITNGSCSPIGFSFDAINTTDYFETKS